MDGSGRLDRDEAFAFLRMILKQYTNEDPSDEELEKNFNLMDADKSGDIDKDECHKFLKGFELGLELKEMLSPRSV